MIMLSFDKVIILFLSTKVVVSHANIVKCFFFAVEGFDSLRQRRNQNTRATYKTPTSHHTKSHIRTAFAVFYVLCESLQTHPRALGTGKM